MATYFFETITAARALSLAGDTLCFARKDGDPGSGGGGGATPAAEPGGAQTDTGGQSDAAADAEAHVEGDPGPDKVVEAPSLADPASLGFAKIAHPGGATSVSHAGQVYEADKKGVITVPLAAVDDLTSHGFALVS